LSEWKARRFWTSVTVEAVGTGHAIRLDGRPVKTPGKAELIVPTHAMAKAIAAEWDAQENEIDPGAMPFTRRANSAIEKVAPQRSDIAEMLLAYGDSDLLCYRAGEPAALVARQVAAWDPLLDWAAADLGARLIPVVGVMHKPQPAASLAALRAPVLAMTAFELTGFHDLVALSGSLILGLAAARGHMEPDELWHRSRTDEIWQAEHWGADQDAAEAAEAKRRDFLDAHRFLELARAETPRQ